MITADQVLAGLYAWLGDNGWFLANDIGDGDLTAEHAAQQAVLLLAHGDLVAYQALPVRVRALALRLTLDFLAKLMGPLAGVKWPIRLPDDSPASLQAAAWQAIELEIGRSSPPASRPH